MRLSATKQPVTYVLTHDSVGVGEDGPTHQPIEHLAMLRATPGFIDLRPADANETVEAWKIALQTDDAPVGLMLTRQNLLGDAADGGAPDVIIIASGSEVALAIEAHERLVAEGVRSRVVNMASMQLFTKQDADYRESVLPLACSSRLAVEAGVTFGWDRWVGDGGQVIGIDRFGASAPAGPSTRSSASPPTTSTPAPRLCSPEPGVERPLPGAPDRGAPWGGRGEERETAAPAAAAVSRSAGGIVSASPSRLHPRPARSHCLNPPRPAAYDMCDCVRTCSTMSSEHEGSAMSQDVSPEVHEMIPAERRARIVELLEERRAVRVSVLSETLGVSEMTIRRDLEQLEQAGLLSRMHGGAILKRRMVEEPLYATNVRAHSEEKRRIAKAAAQARSCPARPCSSAPAPPPPRCSATSTRSSRRASSRTTWARSRRPSTAPWTSSATTGATETARSTSSRRLTIAARARSDSTGDKVTDNINYAI